MKITPVGAFGERPVQSEAGDVGDLWGRANAIRPYSIYVYTADPYHWGKRVSRDFHMGGFLL
jgi:hypothetical protein